MSRPYRRSGARRVAGLAVETRTITRGFAGGKDRRRYRRRPPIGVHSRPTPPPRRHAPADRPSVPLGSRARTHRRSRSRVRFRPNAYRVRSPPLPLSRDRERRYHTWEIAAEPVRRYRQGRRVPDGRPPKTRPSVDSAPVGHLARTPCKR